MVDCVNVKGSRPRCWNGAARTWLVPSHEGHSDDRHCIIFVKSCSHLALTHSWRQRRSLIYFGKMSNDSFLLSAPSISYSGDIAVSAATEPRKVTNVSWKVLGLLIGLTQTGIVVVP